MTPSKHTQPPIWDADPAGPPDGTPEYWRTSVIELSRRIFLQTSGGAATAQSALGAIPRMSQADAIAELEPALPFTAPPDSPQMHAQVDAPDTEPRVTLK